MSTIYDVAKRAGVSPATVSRVFNGIPVNPRLAEAVREAAAELTFVPNRNARRLRTKTSQIIAMLIPDVENPFFTTMTRAVEDVARMHGYAVMLCNTDEDPEREAQYLMAAVSDPVAGIITAPVSDDSRLDAALTRGVPVVCVDRTAPAHDVDSVVVDNVAGARSSTLKLFDLGFRRVACLSGGLRVQTGGERAEGWRQAVVAATGKEPDEALIHRTRYTVASGEAAMAELLALPEPPDAVFAATNKLSLGALRALIAADRQPPGFGVLSFGDLPLLTYTPQGVIVAHLPAREIGLTAAQLLLDRIAGQARPSQHIVLPPILGDDQAAWTSSTSGLGRS